MSVNDELGLIHVYTGRGKGKTTASLGLGLRAVGHGYRVHMIQFMKGRTDSGELVAVEKLAPLFTISRFGGGGFIKDNGAAAEDIELALLGMQEALDYMRKEKCDLLILDEIGNALRYNLVTVAQVKDLIKAKPAKMELVMTGRGMPEEIMEIADLVTEMTEIKHPFNKGVSSRRGVEY